MDLKTTPETAFALDAEALFDLAPVSLWLEDCSGVHALFSDWCRNGVTDLEAFLAEDAGRALAAAAQVRFIDVNRRTLELFEASDFDALSAHLNRIVGTDRLVTYIGELARMWNGARGFSASVVNHTLAGRRLDLALRGVVLPGAEEDWSRILIAIEDVSAREQARREAEFSAAYANGLFQHSPASLWVEDFSAVKALTDDLRMRGIDDFRSFLNVHPEFVERCLTEIRLIDVNRHTLDLFGAPSREALLLRFGDIFGENSLDSFREQLVDLWEGRLFHTREVVNYTLGGDKLYLHLQFSVLPGFEHDWSQVQIALTNITARKKAEAYLEYLGKHDVLTRLHNRSFYVDELNRLQRKRQFPVTILIMDLDGLKAANDLLGHAAGDALLRRAGEVLANAVSRPAVAARIGGDEFAVLMAGADEHDGEALMEHIRKLTELNNQFHSEQRMSLSVGMATSRGETLEDTVRRADTAMYEEKRRRYGEAGLAG